MYLSVLRLLRAGHAKRALDSFFLCKHEATAATEHISYLIKWVAFYWGGADKIRWWSATFRGLL